MESEEFVYGSSDRSGVDIGAVERLTKELLTEMSTAGSEANDAAIKAGINVDHLQVEGRPAIRFGSHDAGLTGVDIVIVFATKVAYDAWKQILLPRINKRLDKRSLIEKEKRASGGKDRGPR